MAKDQLDDFTKQIEEIQKKRKAQQKNYVSNGLSGTTTKAAAEAVRMIAQVVTTLVSADGSLTFRETSSGIYISYAYTHICIISVTPAAENTIQVEFKILNFNQQAKNTIVYTGTLQKKEIQEIAKEELMTWYASFS
jgi:hypothetical protein